MHKQVSERQVAANQSGDRGLKWERRRLREAQTVRRAALLLGPNAEQEAASANQGLESVHEPITKGNGTGSTQGSAAEKHVQNGQTDPSSGLESTT